MFALVNKFRKMLAGDRRGVTALEYGLLAAIIGGVVITGAGLLGNSLGTTFNTISTHMTTAA
ncbi:MAG: Flp family type IVb pilin [Rhodospirillales bacterium]|nr:Flp family type IVb pilin [Rhodospirillales bacterium]MDE2575270.1 Flp family type IVb pilin [Rhodospirillales bacterium]